MKQIINTEISEIKSNKSSILKNQQQLGLHTQFSCVLRGLIKTACNQLKLLNSLLQCRRGRDEYKYN